MLGRHPEGRVGTRLTFLISSENGDVDVPVKLGVCNSVQFSYVCIIPDRLGRRVPLRVIHDDS